jgi:hypothetical protein
MHRHRCCTGPTLVSQVEKNNGRNCCIGTKGQENSHCLSQNLLTWAYMSFRFWSRTFTGQIQDHNINVSLTLRWALMGFVALSTNYSFHILYHCFFLQNTDVKYSCMCMITHSYEHHTYSILTNPWTARLEILEVISVNCTWQYCLASPNRIKSSFPLSFYMVVHLTRNANQHGKIKGRHWNGRFHFVCVLLTQVWKNSVLTFKHIMR